MNCDEDEAYDFQASWTPENIIHRHCWVAAGLLEAAALLRAEIVAVLPVVVVDAPMYEHAKVVAVTVVAAVVVFDATADVDVVEVDSETVAVGADSAIDVVIDGLVVFFADVMGVDAMIAVDAVVVALG